MNQVAGFSFYKVLQEAATALGDGTAVEVAAISRGMPVVLALQVEGISGDTITFEGTIDGSTWYPILFEDLTTGTEATTATADGLYRGIVIGLAQVRARISAYGAGNITVVGYLSS